MRKSERRRRDDSFGYLCLDSPVCYAVEVKFDKTTITLGSIDLYDPDAANPDDVWTSIPPPFSNQATTAALKALRRACKDGQFTLDLCNEGCECKLSGAWGGWTPPHDIDIVGGFSIQGPTKRLRYRANGTVKGVTRMQAGGCYRIDL